MKFPPVISDWVPNWTAPIGKLGSHRRQTVDAIVNVFHRLAAGGYETTKWRCPTRVVILASLTKIRSSPAKLTFQSYSV